MSSPVKTLDFYGNLYLHMTDKRTSSETEQTTQEWIRDFEAAAKRSLEQRLNYAFIHTYKPVMDDEPFRSFDTMASYRRWCEEHLPRWLGYGRTF